MKAPFFRPATRARKKKKHTHKASRTTWRRELKKKNKRANKYIEGKGNRIKRQPVVLLLFFSFLFSRQLLPSLFDFCFVSTFFFFFHKEKKSGVFFFLDREGEGLARNNIHTPHITSNSSKQQQQKKKDESNNNNNNN